MSLFEAWYLTWIAIYHPHMNLPSQRNHPYKVSYLPTWQLMEISFKLELQKWRWAENFHMVSIIAYPMLSSSPLVISVECVIISGYNGISLKWKNEEQSSKDLPSNIGEQGGPKHFIHDEHDMVIIEYPNGKYAEGFTWWCMIQTMSQEDTTQSHPL